MHSRRYIDLSKSVPALTTDEKIAHVILTDEGHPAEWRVPNGYLVPIRPWWCFWRPRKVCIRVTHRPSVPREEAHRKTRDAGHKTGKWGYLFGETWF